LFISNRFYKVELLFNFMHACLRFSVAFYFS